MAAAFQRVAVVHDGPQGQAPASVLAAIERLGLTGVEVTVDEDLDAVAAALRRVRPDVIVNDVRSLGGDPARTPDVAAALELLEIPFTGAGPAGLYLVGDPLLGRRLLASHGVAAVPRSGSPQVGSEVAPPSPGASEVEHEIEGTDVRLALVGNEPPEVYGLGPDADRFGEGAVGAIHDLARRAQAALRLRDAALITVRVAPDGAVWLVDAVPNPPLGEEDELASLVRAGGWEYDALIQRLLDEAWARRDLERRPSASR